MPFTTQKLTVIPAKITATDPENRLVNVKYLNMSAGVTNVIVLSSHGNLSFPNVGDCGLVLRFENWAYYLGTIEYGFARRIAGELKDETTGQTLLAKLIKDGEVFLNNVKSNLFLALSNNGDINLVNGRDEGLSYTSKFRLLKTAALTLRQIGNGVTSAIGSVVRDLPGLGPTISIGDSGGPAVEAFTEVKENGVKLSRLHLGYVKDTTLGVDEVSSYASRVRAVLEVCAGPVPLAYLKIDELGNIELSSASGNMSQTVGQNLDITTVGGKITETGATGIEHTAVGGDYVANGITVKLGGAAANQAVMRGTAYTAAEASFLTKLTTFTAFLTTFFTALTGPTIIDPAVKLAAAAMAVPVANFTAAIAQFQADISANALSTKTFTS